MTVPNQVNQAQYVGTGTDSTYEYTFRIFSASDLIVTTMPTTGIITTLVLNTDYTVDGVLSYTGGVVTLLAGNLPTGTVLTITRDAAEVQQTSLRNQSSYNPGTVEDALDLLTMEAQALRRMVQSSLRVPLGDSQYPINTFPSATLRANGIVAFDANGEAIVTTGAAGLPVLPIPARTVIANDTGSTALATATSIDSLTVLSTGSVSRRSLATRFSDILNVKDFGAVGDGVTDDTAAFVAAAAAMTNGSTLYIPRPGSFYLISQQNAGAADAFGRRIMRLNSLSNITIYGNRSSIKLVNYDITANLGLVFIWGDTVKGLTVYGLDFDYTCTGFNNSSSFYPYVAAIVVQDGTATGVKPQSQLSSDIFVHDCTFKLFHPYGQYVVTGNPYLGDPNNGYKLMSIFVNGDYLGATYATQNRNVTIRDCTWKDGHNGYGVWVWSYNAVMFENLRGESWVGKKSNTSGAVLGTGVAMIRYHQFLCSGVGVVDCDFRAKPSSERITAGFEGAAVFCWLDTNQTGDYSFGKSVVDGNRIQVSNGDAVNSLVDYGIELSVYGSIAIIGNDFDGDASATNAFGSVGIYGAWEPGGGDGKASLTIEGNNFGGNCSYMQNISLANGSNVSAYQRRLKVLTVVGNTSLSQSQYFLDMTANSAATYVGVASTVVADNIIIGTYNTLFNSASTNSRAFQFGANQATDTLVVRDNIVKDKNRFAMVTSVNASADVSFMDNRLSGVTTIFSGGTFLQFLTNGGTFTPVVVGTTIPGAGTYTVQSGRYVRLGTRIFFDINLSWSAHTGTGNIQINGLPVSSVSSIAALAVTYSTLVVGAGKELGVHILVGTTAILLRAEDQAGGADAAVAMDTSVTINITGSYEVT